MSEWYIKIVHRCERRRTGWTPAFHLCLIDARLVRILSQFSRGKLQADIYVKGAAAESQSERQARDWCRRNFPGLASEVERMMALDVALSDEPLATSERHTRVERKGADR